MSRSELQLLMEEFFARGGRIRPVREGESGMAAVRATRFHAKCAAKGRAGAAKRWRRYREERSAA